MPVTKDPVWVNTSRRYVEGDAVPHVTCNHCGHGWKSKELKRVKNHMLRCANIPEIERERYKKPAVATLPQSPSQPRAQSQSKWTQRHQDATIRACAQWLYESGPPLSTIDHPAFRAFVKALNPEFVVPERQALSESLFEGGH